MEVSTVVGRIAKLVSVMGHPLVTLPLVFTGFAFRQLPLEKAVITSAVLLGAVILPLTWRIHRQVQRGQYTNFDLSNQPQRAGFYPILLVLSGLFNLFLFLVNHSVNRGAVCFFGLLASSYGINFWLKVSLHTSVSFFLSCALYRIDALLGVFMGLFSILVAASRLLLGRHSLLEILVGVLVGLLMGAGL